MTNRLAHLEWQSMDHLEFRNRGLPSLLALNYFCDGGTTFYTPDTGQAAIFIAHSDLETTE
jgi:hypothetical protein